MRSDEVIVVAGEALIDLVLSPTDDLAAHPGGGPFNTARTLGRLEQPVAYLGCISEDRLGTRLRQGLTDDGVSLDAAVSTSRPTTLALAEIDQTGSASYRFYTDGTSAAGLTPEAALSVLPGSVGMLHVGTLGLVLEPLATALEAVVEAVAGRALIMVDPNCRPPLIPDRDVYRGRLAGTLRSAQLVKASVEDLAWLDPGQSAASAARRLLSDGPLVGVVTLGAEGALVVTADAELEIPAPPAELVDTIGAGDSFSGGFLAWWRMHGLAREDLRDLDAVAAATRFACLVAARTCERAGASPPRLSEIEA
jgi:fructokinase